MIVVAGDLGMETGSHVSPSAIATRAAELGAGVEVVGIVAPDASGDRRLLALAGQGIGHAAVLRSPAIALEPADLDLALRYLPDVRAVVLVDPAGFLLATAAAAATWSGAGLIAVTSQPGAAELADELASDRALVLDPPASDPDATFAGFVAALAVRLDSGLDPATAWRATTADHAVDRVSGAIGS